jgi:hypothetical protein
MVTVGGISSRTSSQKLPAGVKGKEQPKVRLGIMLKGRDRFERGPVHEYPRRPELHDVCCSLWWNRWSK